MNFAKLALLACSLLPYVFGCKNKPNEKFDFDAIKKIEFVEVRRTFDNGYIFNHIGFQQEPEWKIKFLGNDSVQAFNPTENKMETFHLLHDHDEVYNFAGEWFRVKSVSKDSLLFQRLQVNNKVVMKDVRSNVYMKFYALSYINKINQSISSLRRPQKKDSSFVKKRIEKTNNNIFDSTQFFAARNPVKFISNSKLIKIIKTDNSVNEIFSSKSYDYLYPEYKITIYEAYKDFSYYIKAIVDKNGRVFVLDFAAMDDYKENRRKVIQGILDVYINNSVKIVPGNTLGYHHSSVISIDITGKTKSNEN